MIWIMIKNEFYILLVLFLSVIISFGYNPKLRYKYLYKRKFLSKSHLILYDNPPVSIFDNVITPDVSKLLDVCAAAGGLGHSVYNRVQNIPMTPIESIIESILYNLEDNAAKVEYWWRDEWFSLDAHKDIDEKHAINEPQADFRYPRNAHVLYLYIGTNVEGPTLVWTNGNNSTNTNGIYKDIYIVPSVTARLLRFQGDLLHAVPRPALAYIDEEFGGTNYEIFTRNRNQLTYTLEDIKSLPTSAYQMNNSINHNENMILDKFKYRRSVLLFNTWTEDYPDSPVDIPHNPPKDSLFEYNNDISLSSNLNHSISGWYNYEDFNNNDMKSHSNEKIRLKIGFLGDKKRRGYSDRFINLYTNKNIINALKDKYLPSKLPMYNI